MAKNDWMWWVAGLAIAFIGYQYITSQKAGAPMAGAGTDIEPESANVAKTGGCGCGA